MFYVAPTYWFDSDEVKRYKDYCRRSNYYENKLNRIQACIYTINQNLNKAQYNYRLLATANYEASSFVVTYKFSEYEKKTFTKIKGIIESLETKRDTLIKQKELTYELYSRYYHLALYGG